MRLAWLTDIHLNFVSEDRFHEFCETIARAQPDAVLIGGDIAEAATFSDALRELAHRWNRPLYFVLGNHDYFHGSILETRRAALSLHRADPLVTWLPEAGVVPLTEHAALVGHGGWGDGRAGNFLKSNVLINDYLLIRELADISTQYGVRDPRNPSRLALPPELLARLHTLGDEAAEHFETVLPPALERFEHVIVLMHVPPFREACWYHGRNSDDNWAPHFTCVAAGDVLRRLMEQHPHRKMTVLCGHTHGAGEAQILPNLAVFTGHAAYAHPELQRILEVD